MELRRRMNSARYGRFGAFIAALACLAATSPSDRLVREYVDENTAVSVTVATVSLIFARERTHLAVNARDYLALTPLETNRSGRRTLYWSGYLWSTIDPRIAGPLLAPGDDLVLIADGRPVTLKADARTLREHGIAQEPVPAPMRGAIPVLFAADAEILRYVSSATSLQVLHVRGGMSEAFSLWDDRRDGIRAFLERLAEAAPVTAIDFRPR